MKAQRARHPQRKLLKGLHNGFSTAKRDSSTGRATECSHQKDDLWIC
jgi:hypothetical protein